MIGHDSNRPVLLFNSKLMLLGLAMQSFTNDCFYLIRPLPVDQLWLRQSSLEIVRGNSFDVLPAHCRVFLRSRGR
jgi:hypothetical protein